MFLDVGAHYGETLEVALDPRWGFERIYSFEPAEACQRVLRGYRDHRVSVLDRGLSNKTGETILYGAGLLGASVYADKPQYETIRQQVILLERASDWLRTNTTVEDEVFLKLNCEGSECDVLEDLLSSDMLARLCSIYVDFDAAKIPSQAHRQEAVERGLQRQGVNYVTPATFGGGGNSAVYAWLAGSCPQVRSRTSLSYRLRLYRPPYVWAKAVLRAVLPRRVLWWAGRRLGRLSIGSWRLGGANRQ